ncbi:protein KIAA0100 isoform X4 [Eurytemora carolleeae]|nr:protein KIAA0100 isoform X4 [Eurytemora carolleeae]|eukprot:XP_023323171.1 protein KIAA0100-like isoform X4 [Eurytemora affinis]
MDVRLCKPQDRTEVDLMINETIFCYNPALHDLASRVHEVFRPILLQLPPSTPSPKPPPSFALLATQTKFVWSKNEITLQFSLRELEAAGDKTTGEFTLSGVNFSMETSEEQLTWLQLQKLVLNHKVSEPKIVIEQRVKMIWKPNLQVSLLQLVDEINKFKSFLPAKPLVQEETKKPSVYHIQLTDKLSVQVHTGEHSIKVRVPNITAKVANPGISWIQTPVLTVKMDNKQILQVENILLSAVENSDKISTERKRMQGGTIHQNKCFVIAANLFTFTEPYQFNFHKVFFEEFLGVVKWLKVKHGKLSSPNSTLPRDILINIKNCKFELSDDPFEVRLRDNYELQKDEYTESQTRLKVLEERIAEFRRKNLMFPSEKVEELLQNLKKKNAEIYIQRVKKVYQGCKTRTRLLEWELSGLEMMILADPSMHGKTEVVRHLQDFDYFSPWPPESQLSFTTLWCRWIRVQSDSFTVSLRDFPQKLLDIQTLALWGKLAGAEASPTKRAIRDDRVKIGHPFQDQFVERNMVPLKFYYDLACDVETLSMAYGLCWEPTLTQCSLALNYLTGGSKDPSPPLPWWDKVRLLLHGRFLLAARTKKLLLHASLDPYNTTEEMDVSWTDMVLNWGEAEMSVNGTLDIYVRTASKYDDGHLLHLPNLNLQIKMDWICLANPKDHHSVIPCAPNKLPEYSSNQEHDSYRAFRSSNLDLSVQFETRSGRGTRGERPKLDMFSSTLRWFENLKFIFSGATRPIRRGAVFNNDRPKKPHFSRHFKKVDISVSLHQFQVNYWTSFSQQRGILLNVARGIHLAAHHQLNIVPYTDGLRRRAKADWTVSYISCDLTTSDIWIQTAIIPENESNSNPPSPSNEEAKSVPPTPTSGRETINSRISRMESSRNMERSFFFCVEKVLYTRNSCEELGKPTHRLVIHGARGAWTQSNRDMFFALYDSWRRAQILRKNVSSDALKLFYSEKPIQTQPQEKTPFTSPTPASTVNSPFSWGAGASKVAGSMLDRLLQETEGGATPTAYSEDMSGEEEVKHSLEAMAACTKDDIVHWNWSIELVNSQLLMRGIETQGYVIMSAARASVSQNLHRPVWKERALLSKTTWSGGLESMQYYATVSEEGADLDNIMWLTLDNIGEGEEGRVPGPAGVVGSGKAVGGVVSKVVGVTDSPGNLGIQLQRVVSRCKAEFFYVSYGDTALDDVEASVAGACKMSGSPITEDEWNAAETAVNAFTLVHHDLNVCTNSLQYVMLLDIINNLLLYSEPTLKARTDKYLRMRYQFMLEIDTIEKHRKKIIQLQNQLRQLACTQREKEKEIYLLSNTMVAGKRLRMEAEGAEIKDRLLAISEDLDMMIRCYKETQMSSSQRQSALRGQNEGAKLRRRGEICFSKAAWRLTEVDGQLGIADINISNFLFTRSSMSDDSVENLLEMGWVNVRNLLPNQLYENVLTPTELKRDIPVDRQRTVRVYSRERARVGGISVKDHFEINVSPLTIGITAHFYKKMMTFAFPEKDAEIIDEDFEIEKKQKKKLRKSKNTNFYVECPNIEKDDVEKMKERAERNKLFIYIKIPEVPIKVSYKGEKEKNQILDVADFQLQVPTLEYHNVTWTWLDLLLAVKSRTRESLVTQAIKQKFLRNKANAKDEQAPGEEEKARMLLGSSSMPGGVKPGKRFLSFRN